MEFTLYILYWLALHGLGHAMMHVTYTKTILYKQLNATIC